MNTTSQFTSNFWNIYIAVIVVLSFIGLAWLLLSQNVVKRPKRAKKSKRQVINGTVLKNTTTRCRVGGFGCMFLSGCSVSAT